jgi:hypothetical protein
MKGTVKVSLTVEREFDLEDLTAGWTDTEKADLRIDDPLDDEAGAKHDEAVEILQDECMGRMINGKNDDVFIEDFKIKFDNE